MKNRRNKEKRRHGTSRAEESERKEANPSFLSRSRRQRSVRREKEEGRTRERREWECPRWRYAVEAATETRRRVKGAKRAKKRKRGRRERGEERRRERERECGGHAGPRVSCRVKDK